MYIYIYIHIHVYALHKRNLMHSVQLQNAIQIVSLIKLYLPHTAAMRDVS